MRGFLAENLRPARQNLTVLARLSVTVHVCGISNKRLIELFPLAVAVISNTFCTIRPGLQ